MREQKAVGPNVLAVLLEGFPELGSQHGFFFPRLDPIAQDDQSNSRDASPFVDS